MSSPKTIALLVTEAVLDISGLICNGFIVIVIIQWTKCRTLASIEQLLLSLALSNGCVTIVIGVFHFGFASEDNFSSLIFEIWYSFFFFAVIFRYWLTALLCFFYCIKIVSSTHTFFLWCKLRMSWLIPRLLVGSVIIALLAFIVSLSTMHISPQESPVANDTMLTRGKLLKETITSFDMFFSAVGSGCPFLVVLLCSILVVASLCGHICQMSGKEPHLRSFQTKAHIKAAGTVLSLLLLYLLFFIVQTFSMTENIEYSEEFILAVMAVYSPAQAAILVLNNPKLKKGLSLMVQRIKL
ncbi:taste receptor type 2 member 143-like [Anolis carolinensis]|nr:PREDICTED: taste receptor type 2 member 143-like [Anolis carolinensis]|eukprot:XP_016846309.1 PREDICTED: taste receptor type 2 member 143-like [Anolis carolinensis]